MDIKAAMDRIIAEAQAVKIEIGSDPDPDPVVRQVRAGESLQAALDIGGSISLEAGVTWEGTYTLKSGTKLIGNGAILQGITAPALITPPGTDFVSVTHLDALSAHPEVITIGENTDRQTSIDDCPHVIRFTDVRVLHHDGKRAFAIHGRDVELLNCSGLDVWSTARQDSQAWYIGNTPGPVSIRGGEWSAGSEIGLVGGEKTKIPGVIPKDILVEETRMFRPLSWQTDGVYRKVKNIFELKSGHDVIVRGNVLEGCWQQAQPLGAAFVLTPTLDGGKDTVPQEGGDIKNVLIEGNTVRDVGQIFQIAGRDHQTITPGRLTGLVVKGNPLFSCSRAKYGGFGQLAQIGRGPGEMVFEDNVFEGDGTSLIYTYRDSWLDPDGVKRPASNIIRLALLNNRSIQVGKYGLFLDGVDNARSWPLSIDRLDVTGNTFVGSTIMQKLFPLNTWM